VPAPRQGRPRGRARGRRGLPQAHRRSAATSTGYATSSGPRRRFKTTSATAATTATGHAKRDRTRTGRDRTGTGPRSGASARGHPRSRAGLRPATSIGGGSRVVQPSRRTGRARAPAVRAWARGRTRPHARPRPSIRAVRHLAAGAVRARRPPCGASAAVSGSPSRWRPSRARAAEPRSFAPVLGEPKSATAPAAAVAAENPPHKPHRRTPERARPRCEGCRRLPAPRGAATPALRGRAKRSGSLSAPPRRVGDVVPGPPRRQA
jgi:hypothetical protein